MNECNKAYSNPMVKSLQCLTSDDKEMKKEKKSPVMRF